MTRFERVRARRLAILDNKKSKVEPVVEQAVTNIKSDDPIMKKVVTVEVESAVDLSAVKETVKPAVVPDMHVAETAEDKTVEKVEEPVKATKKKTKSTKKS